MDLSTPEGWKPEPGDVIVGKVREVTKGWSDYTSAFYPILVIEKEEDGEAVSVHAFHSTLMSRLLDLKPAPGERIGIKFDGKRPTKDGKREVAVYTVRVDGRSATDVWASMAPSQAPAVPPTDVPAPDMTHPGSGAASGVSGDDIPF